MHCTSRLPKELSVKTFNKSPLQPTQLRIFDANMSQIRKKSLVATSWIYIGFLIGAINTFLFARKGFFTTGDYGLTRSMMDIALLFSASSAFGSYTLIIKFHPYYNKRLAVKENDLFTTGLVIALVGFLTIAAVSYLLQPLIIRKFSGNAQELVHYFYWILPLAFGMLIYTLLEYHSWNYGKQVLTNILREVVVRVFVLLLIILKLTGTITLHQFFILFCFQYILITIIITATLIRHKQISLVFSASRVTQKLKKQIRAMLLYGFSGSVVSALRVAIDSIVLSSLKGLSSAGIFTLASFAASLLQAPFRSLTAISFPLLAQAWKEKNTAEIQRIYQRSSINLLLFALFIFGCIWISFEPAITYFQLDEKYLAGKWVLVLLSIGNIVEMGTGVNGQIIATSTAWRFEFYTNLLLGCIITPCSYFFTKWTGIAGPALATLLGLCIYNTLRILFLYRRYKLFPFTQKTLVALLLFALAIVPSKLIHWFVPGLPAILLGNLLFAGMMTAGILWLKVSPDAGAVVNNLLKKAGSSKRF